MSILGSLAGGIGGATVGNAVVSLGLDTSRITRDFARARQQVDAEAKAMGTSVKASTAIGQAAMATFGIAAAAAAAAAVRMAVDFDNAFTKISALSNASAGDIRRWRGEVLDLAGETAVAPQELADALFFLSSAGLEAAEVMPALEVSARGAAVGLGTTADVANIVASAMNAYADAGLTAASVTDTLVAAVREGRAEPTEFAAALGRILPIASRADVSFQDVTASLAQLSNIGLDVDEGVTAMRGALQAIVAPGKQAADAMASIGLTAQDLLTAIQEDGLIGALRLLDDAARANTTTQADYIGTLREVIPNVRALTGVLGLTGQEAEAVDETFRRVSDSTGSLAEAFDETASSPGFAMRQALAEIQANAIALGDDLLPLVATIADLAVIVSDVVPTLVDLAVAFGALRFAPVLLRGIALGIGAVGAASKSAAIGNLASTFAALAPRVSAVAAAFILLKDPIADALRPMDEIAEEAGVTADTLDRITSEVKGFGASESIGDFLRGATDLANVTTRAEEASAAYAALRAELIAAGLSGDQVYDIFLDNIDVLDRNRDSIDGWIAAMRGSAQEQLAWAARQKFAGIQMEAAEAAAQAVTERTRDYRAAVDLLTRDLEGLSALGIDVTGFLDDFRASLEASEDPTATFAEGVADITEKWVAFRDSLAEGLSFVDEAFGELGRGAQGSATRILEAFKSSARETRAFGEDLLEIAKIGGPGGEGEQLAAWLAGLGPEGVRAADTIANASGRMKEQMVAAFAEGQGAAEDLATRLTRRIVGTLENIETILGELAHRWGIDVDLDDHGAAGRVADLRAELERLSGTYHVSIDLRGGVTAGTATGGIIGGLADGGITQRPTYLVGEGGYATFAGPGSEAVIPLNDRGIGVLSEAMRRAMERGGGRSGGGITVTISGDVYAQDADSFRRVVTDSVRREIQRTVPV